MKQNTPNIHKTKATMKLIQNATRNIMPLEIQDFEAEKGDKLHGFSFLKLFLLKHDFSMNHSIKIFLT